MTIHGENENKRWEQLAYTLSGGFMSELAEGHRIGPYRIVRLLGKGGRGAVYEARHEPLERRVALKMLHPEYAHDQDALARFFNEARTLSRLEHPSIVQASDFGNAPDGTAYLVMEYLRGQSLGRRLAAHHGRLPVIQALEIAWEVAEVLAIAHAQGIVHRDLKPDNLMLVPDPVVPGGERVKVLDFGIAKLTRAIDRGEVKTDTQELMGTPMYMSPEQCAGAGGVDAKSDVYSLGCVLYEMIGGRPPFTGDGAGELIGKHLFQKPDSLAALAPRAPPAVIELVHRLLTKDKNLRPSMSETVEALGHLLSQLAGTGPVTRARPVDTDLDSTLPFPMLRQSTNLGQATGQPSRSISRRQWLAAGVAVWAPIAVGAVAWHGHMPRQPSVRTSVPVMPAAPPSVPSMPPKLTLDDSPSHTVPKVRWEVDTKPPGATVLDETGNVLGTTPWTEEHSARAGILKLRLRINGYREETLALDKTTGANRALTLIPLPSPKAQVGGPRPARPSSPSTHAKPTGMTYED